MLCVFQIIYIGCAYATVYLIYLKFKATYDGNHDTFRVEFLVVPVGGLAFLVNHDFSPLEVSANTFGCFQKDCPWFLKGHLTSRLLSRVDSVVIKGRKGPHCLKTSCLSHTIYSTHLSLLQLWI